MLLLRHLVDFRNFIVKHFKESAPVAVAGDISGVPDLPLVRVLLLVLLAVDVTQELLDRKHPLFADKALQHAVASLVIEAALSHLRQSEVRNVLERAPVFLHLFVFFLLLPDFLPIRS